MTEYTEPPTRNYHREIVEERDHLRIENDRLRERNTSLAEENFHLFELLNENNHLRTQLQTVIAAWEALPDGLYYPERIERWLIRDMKPVIDDARATLGDTNT